MKKIDERNDMSSNVHADIAVNTNNHTNNHRNNPRSSIPRFYYKKIFLYPLILLLILIILNFSLWFYHAKTIENILHDAQKKLITDYGVYMSYENINFHGLKSWELTGDIVNLELSVNHRLLNYALKVGDIKLYTNIFNKDAMLLFPANIESYIRNDKGIDLNNKDSNDNKNIKIKFGVSGDSLENISKKFGFSFSNLNADKALNKGLNGAVNGADLNTEKDKDKWQFIKLKFNGNNVSNITLKEFDYNAQDLTLYYNDVDSFSIYQLLLFNSYSLGKYSDVGTENNKHTNIDRLINFKLNGLKINYSHPVFKEVLNQKISAAQSYIDLEELLKEVMMDTANDNANSKGEGKVRDIAANDDGGADDGIKSVKSEKDLSKKVTDKIINLISSISSEDQKTLIEVNVQTKYERVGDDEKDNKDNVESSVLNTDTDSKLNDAPSLKEGQLNSVKIDDKYHQKTEIETKSHKKIIKKYLINNINIVTALLNMKLDGVYISNPSNNMPESMNINFVIRNYKDIINSISEVMVLGQSMQEFDTNNGVKDINNNKIVDNKNFNANSQEILLRYNEQQYEKLMANMKIKTDFLMDFLKKQFNATNDEIAINIRQDDFESATYISDKNLTNKKELINLIQEAMIAMKININLMQPQSSVQNQQNQQEIVGDADGDSFQNRNEKQMEEGAQMQNIDGGINMKDESKDMLNNGNMKDTTDIRVQSTQNMQDAPM